jgi:glycosyltransferase 2 family protein
MPKSVQLVFRYGFFLALGLILAWISIRSSYKNWAGMKVALSHARYYLLIPIVFLYLLSHWCRAVRWKIMIEPLGYKPVTLDVFFSVMIGYLVNLAIPRLGEVMRCTFLGRHEKIPIEKLLGTIIVERAFDLVCLLIVFFTAYSLQARVITDYVLDKLKAGNQDTSHLNLYIGLGLLVLVLIGYLVLRRMKNHRLMDWAKKMVLGLWEGIYEIRYMKKKGWFLFHTVLIWTLYFLCTRLGMLSIRELDGLGYTETFSVLSVGSVAMIVAPGGLGAYPLFVSGTLERYHIPDQFADAGGQILWAVPTLLILIGGVISFVGMASPTKKSKDEKLPAYQPQDLHS